MNRHLVWHVVLAVVGLALAHVTAASAGETAAPSVARAGGTTPDEEGRPSLTALSAANYRAAHQFLDQPRVFEDPLALRIIGAEGAATLRANPQRYRRAAGLRAMVAVRSRFTEDELARAVQRGVRQYVILGAGFDTFAYRNPHPAARLRVFEVDLPSTQAWKRKRIGEVGITIPDSLTFAPVDFEKQTLADGLRRAGFKADEPAFFSLLGVVVYLSREAVTETLKFVAAMPAGSEIVFDYAVPASALGKRERAVRDAFAERVAAIGEPWITFFDPVDLAVEMRRVGFDKLEDVTPAELNRRYLNGRADGLRVGNGSHLMKGSL